jgi:hypothetical protein
MLQIGHRKSFDFDCFSTEKLPSALLQKAKRIFGPATTLKTKTSEILTVITPEGVDVTFVWYPYPPLKPPLATFPLSIAHMDDLAANKAFTLGRRPAWRDYVDLFFLLKWNRYTLKDIIDLSQKKYSGEFNDKLFLKQLVYFEDLEIVDTAFLKESYTTEEIQTFLEKQVEAYLKTALAI